MGKKLPPRDAKGRFKRRRPGYTKRSQVRRNVLGLGIRRPRR